MTEPLSETEIDEIMCYWEQPTGMVNAPAGMVPLAQYNLAQFKATIDSERAARRRYEEACGFCISRFAPQALEDL